MSYSLCLYSTMKDEVYNFFNLFYDRNDDFSTWKPSLHFNVGHTQNTAYIYTKKTTNPLDFVVLLGALVDNDNKYNITPWLSLDKGIFINITPNNINSIIKYIYERFPY